MANIEALYKQAVKAKEELWSTPSTHSTQWQTQGDLLVILVAISENLFNH